MRHRVLHTHATCDAVVEFTLHLHLILLMCLIGTPRKIRRCKVEIAGGGLTQEHAKLRSSLKKKTEIPSVLYPMRGGQTPAPEHS